jgi:phosphodiesterase/alkaline phosphatase D-like protein
MVHQVLVDNLQDNTEYHYQIVAHDEVGNEVVGSDEIVRTPLDTEGPKITNVKTDIMPLGDSDSTAQVIVSWTTNKPSTTKVEFDEGIIGGRYTKSSTEDTSLNNSHTVIIKGLNVANTYHYRIVTKDKRGNTTISNDYTFVTPSKEQSIWQLIVKSLQDTFAWTKNVGSIFKRK